jgi:hypothetical protein
MPAGEGIAAESTATFKLPIGRRYHELQLVGAGTTFVVADITEIRVFANNKVIHRYSGTDRDMLNQFDGRAAANTSAAGFQLVIPFDRFFLNTLAADEETALNTGSLNEKTGEIINSLYLEVDIGAGATGTLALNLDAEVSESLPGGPGTILHIMRHTRDIAGSGDFDIADLPRGTATTMALNRIVFDPSANTISRVKVERNQYVLFDRLAERNRRIQADGVRVPVGDWYVLDRTEKGYGGDPIDLMGAADYRYILTVSGAMTVKTLSEYLGRLGD